MNNSQLEYPLSKSEYRSISTCIEEVTLSDEIRCMFSDYQDEGVIAQFEYMFVSPYGAKYLKQDKGIDYNEVFGRVKNRSRFCRKVVFNLIEIINRFNNIKKMLSKKGLLGIKKFHPTHKYEKIIYFSNQLCFVSGGVSMIPVKSVYKSV